MAVLLQNDITAVVSSAPGKHDVRDERDVATKKTKRLGRPPAAESADTRQRLLDTARQKFAEVGYQLATNKDLADAAGITTGAIYHYFGSKRDLYEAVFDHVEETVYSRYRTVLVPDEGFIASFHRILDEAVSINHDDPSIAQFFVEVQTESARNPELADLALRQARDTATLLGPLVKQGYERGEIAPDVPPRDVTLAMMALLSGIARFSAASGDESVHAAITDVLKRLISGHLFTDEAQRQQLRPTRSRRPLRPARTTA